jgi:clan AA aspartic protease (TIGR02281 family)
MTFTAPCTTIPADLEDLDMPFVQAQVGDHTCTFLIDTGATFTVISTDVAEAAGIMPAAAGTEIATATTQRLAVSPAVLPRLAIGSVVFENHPCVVADSGDMNFTYMLFSFLKLDGVLGWNAIRKLDLEVDFRVPEVTIREPRPRAATRNLFWLGVPIVRAHLADGIPILADLDTGGATSNLLPSFFKTLPESYWRGATGETREGSIRVWGAGGSERVRTRTVDNLSVVLDRHVLEFRRLRSHGRSLAAIFVPVLQLGNDFALRGRMRIDFANGALELGR